MFTLKKLDLASVALYSFLMILIISLIFTVPFGFIFMAIQSFIPDTGLAPGEFEGIFPAFGWAFIIGMPILYAAFGTIINILIAFTYNLLSKKFGGIKFSLNKIAETSITNE